MSRRLYLELAKAFRTVNFPSAAPTTPEFVKSSIPRLRRNFSTTLSTTQDNVPINPRRRQRRPYVCSDCQAAAANKTEARRVRRDPLPTLTSRRNYSQQPSSEYVAVPDSNDAFTRQDTNDLVPAHYENAGPAPSEPPPSSDLRDPNLATSVVAEADEPAYIAPEGEAPAVSEGWRQFIEICRWWETPVPENVPENATVDEGNQIIKQLPMENLSGIFEVLADHLSKGRSANKLRTVAVFLKQNGVTLEPAQLQALVLAQRVLRNWTETIEAFGELRGNVDATHHWTAPQVAVSAMVAHIRLRNSQQALKLLMDALAWGTLLDVSAFRSLLSAAISVSDNNLIAKLFDEMVQREVPLDNRCIAIFDLTLRDDKERWTKLHIVAQGRGQQNFEQDGAFQEATVVTASRLGHLDLAFEHLQNLKSITAHRDAELVAAYTALISACLRQDTAGSTPAGTAEDLYQEMKQLGVKPSVRTMTVLMHGFYQRKALHKVLKYFEEMIELELEPDMSVYNIILRTCVLAGNIRKMEAFYAKLCETKFTPTLPVLTSLMAGYACHHMPESAVAIFEKQLPKLGLKPDIHCFNVIIFAYGLRGDVTNCITWWNRMLGGGYTPDKVSYTSFLRALSRSGNSDVEGLYQRVFPSEVDPDSTAYGLLISDRIRKGELTAAHQFLEELLSSGMKVTGASAAELMKAYEHRGEAYNAGQVLKSFVERGGIMDANMYSAMMIMMNPRERPDEVLKTWDEMKENGIEPNRATFRSVIHAYAAKSDVPAIWATFGDMQLRLVSVHRRDWDLVLCRLLDICYKDSAAFPYLVNAYQLMTDEGEFPSDLVYRRFLIAAVREKDNSICLRLIRDCIDFGFGLKSQPQTRKLAYAFAVDTKDRELLMDLIDVTIGLGKIEEATPAVNLFLRDRDAAGLVHCWYKLDQGHVAQPETSTRLVQHYKQAASDAMTVWDGGVAATGNEALWGAYFTVCAAHGFRDEALHAFKVLQDLQNIPLLVEAWDNAAARQPRPATDFERSTGALAPNKDTTSLVTELAAQLLDYVCSQRNSPTTGRNLWRRMTRLRRYPSIQRPLPADIVVAYIRGLALWGDDVDEFMHLATSFLGDEPGAVQDLPRVVKEVRELVDWKFPEIRPEVEKFWSERFDKLQG
ncbi:uncharacterized protein EV422DRAFT_514182 [Fimicolochytrium jonesii]|uniref:uncharacterized protein n=1 Tax=Fimicolochytrium jonesii TaxID=1396493 RepID=UPI0022FE1190|nr:uncharacterized protein EV422DRAFT_514182 [Fimicolochytrium jonesii]KAI8825797.1 hypothetical protein EV422DRAFT_514182 [Fimicolochytrium jonesii]